MISLKLSTVECIFSSLAAMRWFGFLTTTTASNSRVRPRLKNLKYTEQGGELKPAVAAAGR